MRRMMRLAVGVAWALFPSAAAVAQTADLVLEHSVSAQADDPAPDSASPPLPEFAEALTSSAEDWTCGEEWCVSPDGAAPHTNTGFLDLNYYWDDKDHNGLTIYALANLPLDVTYFQLLNLTGEFHNASDREDLVDYYTELNFWRPIAKHNESLKQLDWNVQFVDSSFDSGLTRFGIQWRFHDTAGWMGELLTERLKLNYSIIFHVLESDGTGMQLEHVWLRKFFDDRIYVRGFADHDLNETGNSTWVTGTQLGLRLFDQFYAVAEHRYNSFLPPEDRSRWRIGIEYNILFR